MTTIPDRFRLRRGTAADLATVNPVPYDSEIVIESDTGTADGKRKFKVGDGVTRWLDLPYFTAGGGDPFATAAGTAQAITVAFTPAITALADGNQLKVRAFLANTAGAPTLKVNALTAHPINKQGGVALVAGDIHGAGHELLLRYVAASTSFELLNPASSLPSGGSTGQVLAKQSNTDGDAVWGTPPGAAVAVGAHRYWMFSELVPSATNGTTNSQYAVSAAEWRLRGSVGGTDLAVSVASASSEFTGQGAALACDGNTGTLWSTNQSNEWSRPWIVFDMGSPVAVAQVRLVARSDAGAYIQTPYLCDVSYSDDGVLYRRLCGLKLPKFSSAGQQQLIALPTVF